MNKKTKIIIMFLIIALLMLILSNDCLAVNKFNPTWNYKNDELTKIGTRILTIVRNIAVIISVIILSIIGIKYMVGSVEERAGYKKALMPFVVGAIILAGASEITNTIFTVAANSNDAAQIGTQINAIDKEDYDSDDIGEVKDLLVTILVAVRNIAVIVAVMMISILGIKYMLGSAEEKAGYKKSMLPLIVGVIIVASAAGIASAIFSIANPKTSGSGSGGGGGGGGGGMDTILERQ